jgi:hypothetical protein
MVVDPETVREKKAIVIANKSKGTTTLYWVGKKVKFLNTHERENNHGRPNHEAVITGFQLNPGNEIIMVKGTYMKDGKPMKLSNIVGTYADDQTLAEEFLKKGSSG